MYSVWETVGSQRYLNGCVAKGFVSREVDKTKKSVTTDQRDTKNEDVKGDWSHDAISVVIAQFTSDGVASMSSRGCREMVCLRDPKPIMNSRNYAEVFISSEII